jgi:hypothetical protein
MELFLDGTSVGSTGKTGSLSTNLAIPVWIGGNPTEPTGKPWKGRIDDVRVYDRALSAAELAALPPPSEQEIFADGFESGDVSAWSRNNVGSLQVLSAAARVGTRGLRAKAGTSCVSPDEVAISPPPPTIAGVYEACRELSAEGVEVVAPGGTLRAGERLSLAPGFSSSADLTLEIDPPLTPFAWTRDTSPQAEDVYTAGFDIRIDSLTLGSSDRLETFVARATTGGVTFRLVLQSDGGAGLEALIEARRDDGTFAATPSGQEVSISPGWHRLRLEWQAGAGTGSLALSIDGVAAGSLCGLANGTRRVDTVEWGVVSGVLDGASGFLDLDSFRSWR